MKAAFTLIELLVVVTIIVILIALLTPALDRSIYQGELAVCATRQRAIVSSVLTYALQAQRRYPYREGLDRFGAQPYALAHGRDGWDDRPRLRPAFDLDLLNDPLTGELRLDPEETDPRSLVFSSYELWFGFRYRPEGAAAGEGMVKLGSRVSWAGDRFPYMVSDRDVVRYDDGFA